MDQTNKLDLSILFRSNRLTGFLDEREELTVSVHKNKVEKYCFELPPLTVIMNFNFVEDCVDGVLRSFCTRL